MWLVPHFLFLKELLEVFLAGSLRGFLVVADIPAKVYLLVKVTVLFMVVAISPDVQPGATTGIDDIQSEATTIEVCTDRMKGIGAAWPLASNLDAVTVAHLMHTVLAVALPQFTFHHLLGDELEVDAFLELQLSIPHFHEVVEH